MRIKSSLLLHPLELVASFKFQNLSQFFNILTFDELKLLWLPLFNWFRDFIWPRYRVNVCVHAKSLQSCPTLCNPMDCSSPDSSVHGDSPGKNTGVGCHFLLQAIFLTQGSNPCLFCILIGRHMLYHCATREGSSIPNWNAQA